MTTDRMMGTMLSHRYRNDGQPRLYLNPLQREKKLQFHRRSYPAKT